MAYKDIPLSTDKLSTSQADIRTNFSEIQTVVSQDHVDFGEADEGKHKQAIFPKQGAAPSTAADEVALYCKDNAGGTPSLYLRGESDGDEIEISGGSTAAATGYATLTDGIIMNWGTITINSGSTNGSQALAKSITNVYGFSFGVRSANVNITTAKNITLTTKTVAAGTLTLTRGGSNDTVYFDYIIIGK